METKRREYIRFLTQAYKLMKQHYREIGNTCCNDGTIAAVVEDFLSSENALLKRDQISGNLQWHKLAGLMASSIMKNRPIQLVPEHVDSKGYRLSRDNEVFAVLQGLAMCASEANHPEIGTILKLPQFPKWFHDFVYVLHQEPSNAEGFMLTFETLSLAYFAKNLSNAGASRKAN